MGETSPRRLTSFTASLQEEVAQGAEAREALAEQLEGARAAAAARLAQHLEEAQVWRLLGCLGCCTHVLTTGQVDHSTFNELACEGETHAA